jgi:aspartate aminotransferase-like enzyme
MPPLNLRIPGPTPLPDEVREALSRPMINHRGSTFTALSMNCCSILAQERVAWKRRW